MPFDFGGFPGGRSHGGMHAEPAVDTNKYYDILGVSKDADTTTIKKAYRKLALACHPDRGGDAEKFKQVSVAYETLSDPEKRKMYDQYGEDGAERGSGGVDISSFFGGGGARSQPKQKKGKDEVYKINATLEQLYAGFTKNMQLRRKVICTTCKGNVRKCTGCNGLGKKTVTQRMGHMITQTQTHCGECRGLGEIRGGKSCTDCGDGSGKKVVKKILEVFVPKNAPDGHKVIFKGDGDEDYNTIPGDVVFVISAQEHNTFKRINDDLFITMDIKLSEALSGVKRVVEQLDKRKILILSNKEQVIKPGQHMMIIDEGMPKRSNPCLHGNLIVTFNIIFPTSITASNLSSLTSLLPKKKAIENSSEYEICHLKPCNSDLFDVQEKSNKQSGNAYDDDDYEDVDDHHQRGGHPGGVQCQQA